jgi:hypothetical protein
MRICPPTLALMFVLTTAGCTTFSLERHCLNQIKTTAAYRYDTTLACLAMVAENPGRLPSYALLSTGTSRVQDTEMLSSATVWTRMLNSFSTETLGVTAIRSPEGDWTVDPVAEYTQLQALRCACRWVLFGPDHACDECQGILNSPIDDPTPGPHFGVIQRLKHLPSGWLHVGCLSDVPLAACYKAHCGKTWVWVMPDETQGLADFTLVLLDIATLDVGDNANEAPPLVIQLNIKEHFPLGGEQKPGGSSNPSRGSGNDSPPPVGNPDSNSKGEDVTYSVQRVVRPECKEKLENLIHEQLCNGTQIPLAEWMACTDPFYGPRLTITSQGVSGNALFAAVNATQGPRFTFEQLLRPRYGFEKFKQSGIP